MTTDTPRARIEGRLLDWFFTEVSITPLVVVRTLGLVALLSTFSTCRASSGCGVNKAFGPVA